MGIFIYGIVNSVQFALFAIGFALVYGISGLANFGHGALYILAGYIVWIALNMLGLNYAVAIILAIVLVAAVGAVMYQFLLKRVRGMIASEIIASFAIGLIIMEGLRYAGLVGASTMVPVLVDGAVDIAGVPVDLQRIFITGMGLVVVVFLYLFTHYTKVGLALRAMSQDERAAMMLGINSDLMAVIAMSLGSALAAIAAVAIFPLGSLRVDTGYNVLLYAVSVSVIGGLGSWPGAIMASFVLGFAQILTVAYVAPQWQMAVVMAAIILTLIFRPSGLFGKHKELEERV